MEIRIDPHTLERAEERGTSRAEIEDVVNNGFPITAKRDRLGKARIVTTQPAPAGLTNPAGR